MKLSPTLKYRLNPFLFLSPGAEAVAALLSLPRFYRDLREFERQSGERIPFRDIYPCLSDSTRTTPFDAHYFYQSAWLARHLAAEKPHQHVDVGSDIRIFNVLSAFIPVECIDFRPLEVNMQGLQCVAGDLTALRKESCSIESLSCLHVVEHIGLGRYGDPVCSDGVNKAFGELQRVLKIGGRLYLSAPVGRGRVCFNAHRVFEPSCIVDSLPDLKLVGFDYVDDHKRYHQHAQVADAGALDYGCGLFVFTKLPS
jgi:hypothetical protein